MIPAIKKLQEITNNKTKQNNKNINNVQIQNIYS